MMGRFGNVPVPDVRSREGLVTMQQRAKAALDSEISLIAFPEGSRTRTGHVGEFQKGVLSIAQKFGAPIVPVSVVGSYQFFQTGNWMLFPEKITVILHDTIETSQIGKADLEKLRQRVQEIVSEPVEESLRTNPVQKV
jgi:1-acyl-sn-glycerol-3-phosphate acyltransferase